MTGTTQTDVLQQVAAAARSRFMIPADEVKQLQQAAGCSMDTLLLSILEEAAHEARPHISNYKVG
jgi:cytidine deaminase